MPNAKLAIARATRLNKIAEANGVPVVANPPLARALYSLDLDTELPAEYLQGCGRDHRIRLAPPAFGSGGVMTVANKGL